MYLNIRARDRRWSKGCTYTRRFYYRIIREYGPGEIASIMGIDQYIAEIIFNAAKKAAKYDGFMQKQNNNNFVKPLSA